MPSAAQRLLAGRAPQGPFLRDGRRIVSVAEFSARAAAAARRLAGARAVINLCETRLGFLAAYAGAVTAGCTTLLPSSRAAEVVDALRVRFAGCRTVEDEGLEPAPPALAGFAGTPGGDLERDQPVMIGFTSGSTGEPTGHAKYWHSVCASTALNARCIRTAIPPDLRERLPWLVGTVPSQHMYGMELTVLLPLLEGMALHAHRPLLPAEVATALAEVPAPRVLISTPAHLRAIVTSGVRLPEVQVVVSATAPLDADLARAVEVATGGCLVETFGSTETCIIGHRETARDLLWQAYPGVRFAADDEGTQVDAPWFRTPQRLLDIIEATDGGAFRLRGRSVDLIDVAGKRASLADLTQRILRIPGVLDAVAFQPDSGRGLVRRVAALIVAPTLTPAAVRAALEPAIDPVFMPRPMVFVTHLPRNAAGKLPRADLEAALADAGRDGDPG